MNNRFFQFTVPKQVSIEKEDVFKKFLNNRKTPFFFEEDRKLIEESVNNSRYIRGLFHKAV